MRCLASRVRRRRHWAVAGVGDVDAHGRADIAWRHPTTGENRVWVMNGETTARPLPLETLPAPWRIAAVGDLIGERVQRPGLATPTSGEDLAWLLDGTGRIGGDPLPVVNDPDKKPA